MPARFIRIHVTVIPEASEDPAYKSYNGETEWTFGSVECPVLGIRSIDGLIQKAWGQASHIKIERDDVGLVSRIVKRVRGLA